MGAGSSSVTVNEGFLQFIVKEFNRVIKDPTRDYATVEEVLAFELPSDWPIHLSHIGVLFALDQTKSGHITPKDAVAFAKVCIKRLPYYRSEDQDIQLCGYFTLKLWEAMQGSAGSAVIVDWLENVVRELLPVAQFDGHPGVLYAGRDAVHLLYILLNARDSMRMEFQEFLDMLQQVGEDMGMMDLAHAQYDDYLPLPVVRLLVAHVAEGMMSTMQHVGFRADVDAAAAGSADGPALAGGSPALPPHSRALLQRRMSAHSEVDYDDEEDASSDDSKSPTHAGELDDAFLQAQLERLRVEARQRKVQSASAIRALGAEGSDDEENDTADEGGGGDSGESEGDSSAEGAVGVEGVEGTEEAVGAKGVDGPFAALPRDGDSLLAPRG